MGKSLAVEYRPKTLDDVVGQDQAKSALGNIIKTGKLPAAVLLSGQTGGGKTTLARIVGRALNCAKLKDGIACGKCQSCQIFDTDPDSHPDWTEVNAATERGIDDVRNLIKLSNFHPTYGCRIVLMDECFPYDTEVMLSNGTFEKIGVIAESSEDYCVKSYNFSTKSFEDQEVISKSPKNGSDKNLVSVELSDGSKFLVTENHKIWSVTRNNWIPAEDLLENEELLPFSFG